MTVYIRANCYVYPTEYAHTLQEFDIACCGVAYDGRAVWCTHKAREAIATGVNIIDLECR
jgi:hypothetical protein